MTKFQQSPQKIQYGTRRSAVYVGSSCFEVKPLSGERAARRNNENSIESVAPHVKARMPLHYARDRRP